MKLMRRLSYSMAGCILLLAGCGKQEVIIRSEEAPVIQTQTNEQADTFTVSDMAVQKAEGADKIEEVSPVKAFKTWEELIAYTAERNHLLSDTVSANGIECLISSDGLGAYVDSTHTKKDLFDNPTEYTIKNIFNIDYKKNEVVEEFNEYMKLTQSMTADDSYLKTMVETANQMFPGLQVTNEEIISEAKHVFNREKEVYTREYNNVGIRISRCDDFLNFSIRAETVHSEDFVDVTAPVFNIDDPKRYLSDGERQSYEGMADQLIGLDQKLGAAYITGKAPQDITPKSIEGSRVSFEGSVISGEISSYMIRQQYFGYNIRIWLTINSQLTFEEQLKQSAHALYEIYSQLGFSYDFITEESLLHHLESIVEREQKANFHPEEINLWVASNSMIPNSISSVQISKRDDHALVVDMNLDVPVTVKGQATK